MKDRVLALVVMVGALVYLYADTKLPTLQIGDPLGPKIFPALVGIGLFVSGFCLLWATRRNAPEAVTIAGAVLPSEPQSSPQEARHHRIVLICMAVWTVIYYTAFEPVGYVISTIVYMLALLAYFNRGKHLANLLIAAGFTAAAYLIFSKFLGVSMPLGLLDPGA